MTNVLKRTAAVLVAVVAWSPVTLGVAEKSVNQRFATRLILPDKRVVVLAANTTFSHSIRQSTVVMRSPEGRTITVSNDGDLVNEAFVLRATDGKTSLTLRGGFGFNRAEGLPDGYTLQLGDTLYRWLVLIDRPAEGTAAKAKMQAAVRGLPVAFLDSLKLLVAIAAAGPDPTEIRLDPEIVMLHQLFEEELFPVEIVEHQVLKPEEAEAIMKLTAAPEAETR